MALIDKLKKRPETPDRGKSVPPKEGQHPDGLSSGKGTLERSYQRAFAAERWGEAFSYLEQWTALDPENLNLVRKQGDLLLKMDRKKEALQKYWEVVLRLCASGQYRQAKALNQVILRVAPNLDQAQKKAMEIEAKLGFFSHPLFSELSEEEFGELVRKTRFRRFPKETIVIRQQESGRSLFMICSGKVDVYIKDTQKGIAQQVARLGEGNFFGEGGFLTGRPRSATVLTQEDTVLLELSKEDLDEVVKTHPRIGEIIQRYHQKRQNP
ncbi:MAG: cyclic nucleotide-binding domain-containing protein [Thermodesulfobacteriota bacterium]